MSALLPPAVVCSIGGTEASTVPRFPFIFRFSSLCFGPAAEIDLVRRATAQRETQTAHSYAEEDQSESQFSAAHLYYFLLQTVSFFFFLPVGMRENNTIAPLRDRSRGLS